MTLVFVRTLVACVCVGGSTIACNMEGRGGASHLWHKGEGVTMQIVHVVHRRRVGGVNFLWHGSGDIETGNNQKMYDLQLCSNNNNNKDLLTGSPHHNM